VDKSSADGCWTWIGCTQRPGYGRVNFGGRLYFAHRISAQFAGMPIGNLMVLHKCDNPPCCNPDHLFLGTRRDNAIDCTRKGRRVYPAGKRGAENPAAILTEENVVEARILRSKGWIYRRLAERYGVHISTISHAVYGLHWKHVPK
jgi:hypothetical protein